MLQEVSETLDILRMSRLEKGRRTPPMRPQTTLKQALTKVHHRMLLATLAKYRDSKCRSFRQ